MKIEFSYHAQNAEQKGIPWVLRIGSKLLFAKKIVFQNVNATTVYDPKFLSPELSRRKGWVEIEGDISIEGEKITIRGLHDGQRDKAASEV